MSTLVAEMLTVTAQTVVVTDDSLTVHLSDGRVLSVPLAWYPRLLHGSSAERNRWRFIGGGVGIHWPDLDEDISVEGMILGRASGESQASFRRWLAERETRPAKSKGRSKPADRSRPTRKGRQR